MDKTPNAFKVYTPPVIRFLVVAFLPAWLLFLLPLLSTGGDGLGLGMVRLIAWSLAMWMPGLGAVLATRWTEKRKLSSLNLGKLGGRVYYLWAWLVPLLLVGTTGIATWALGLGELDVGLTQLWDNLSAFTLPSQWTVKRLVWLQIFAALFIAPFINSAFALGEELGWRGFLLPRLLPLGQTPAMVLSGAIWGVWHIPVILQGHNYPAAPGWGTLMMTGFTILFGVFLSWLYFETQSPWTPAFAHGTFNAVAGLSLLFVIPQNALWGGTVTSATGLLVLGVLVLILYGSGELPVLD